MNDEPMDAGAQPILQFLTKASQFTIPIYQRAYSWEKTQCQQLWYDIERVGCGDNYNVHFVGSIVYIREGYSIDKTPLLVIDGQQRLTTVFLILEALARRLKNRNEQVDNLSDESIRSTYILDKSEERKHKLTLTKTDDNTLQAILDGQQEPSKEHSPRIWENFEFFENSILNLDDLTPLWRGLNKLRIVHVGLNQKQNNPQQIFESMNHRGKELSQTDLIRNFILMDLKPNHQKRLYRVQWLPMEEKFGKKLNSLFDRFIRSYLSLKMGAIPTRRDVYEKFKKHRRNPENDGIGVDKFVEEIGKFAKYYCKIAINKETDDALRSGFESFHELRTESAYPLFLKLYDDYENKLLDHSDFVESIQLISNYILRREICGLDKKAINKFFVNVASNIGGKKHLEYVKARLIMIDPNSLQRFPDDEEFKKNLIEGALYKNKICDYLLYELEKLINKNERVERSKCEIEHIMPQTINREWQKDLGQDSKIIHKIWLHTLGNLTLTGENKKLKNRRFIEKRSVYSNSSIRLTRDLEKYQEWKSEAIQQRAEQLAQQAMTIWKMPQLPPEVLDSYRPKKKMKPTGYTIDDHRFLAQSGVTRQLFDVFREQVLGLAPDITEDVFKTYIAYKAETNFVDIAPQNKRLKLTLNMDFHELNDPKKIATDATNKGTQGNGNVELFVGSEDEIPYVIGLVRQSLEKQMT